MSFGSPTWLLALAAVPLALGAYLYARARAKRYAVRFTALATLRQAAAAEPAWRRHAPAALVLASIAALALALAKPHVTVRTALEQASIMLVSDHSGSMQASDVQPTRLAAAQKAADTLIGQLPSAVRLGAVAFSSEPDAVQGPSTDHGGARQVIDGQTATGATATGDALALALQLLHPTPAKTSHSAIVLLSDGAANTGRDPVSVARQAASDKVPIYTVALGTYDATIPDPNDPFAPPLDVAPDPQLMAQIARTSGGRTFTAQDANTLSSIYHQLGSQLGTRTQKREITSTFAIAGLALLLGAVLTSLRWAGRLP